MKLKNLFYLLLALPLLAVGCSKEANENPSNGPDAGFFMEETLILGQCYEFTDGNLGLSFNNDKGNILLDITLAIAEGDKVLKAETYTAADGNLLLKDSFVAITKGEINIFNFDGGDGTFVVEGDINGYRIDCLLTDAEKRMYHFTYDGKIRGISPNGDLPTEPVNMEAEYLNGSILPGGTYNYFFNLSDKGYGSNGLLQANGNYYQLDIYGLKGEIDSDGYMIMPAGTYTYDETGSHAEWTINKKYSNYTKINEDGSEYYAEASYESATLVVSEDSIVLTVIIGGVEHTVTYNGTPKFVVY